jgi:1-acyl-sn-glycerol-3-phosphate acyltransferase
MIRTFWVLLNLFISTIVLGVTCIIGAILRAPEPFFHWISSTWSGWQLWSSNTPVTLEGLSNVRLDTAQVLVSNHQSWYDVLALAAHIPKRYRFVAKKELSYVPLWGAAWKAAGHISIDRGDRAEAVRALDRAGEKIRADGSSIIIFPEGTRSEDENLLPFKKGAFMLALHSGVDIVPVACIGTGKILPKGRWRVRPARIIVRFGEPISTAGYTEENLDELVAIVRARIEDLLLDRIGVINV